MPGCLALLGFAPGVSGRAQVSAQTRVQAPTQIGVQIGAQARVQTADGAADARSAPNAAGVSAWFGLPVGSIAFTGVPAARLAPLPARLAQRVGEPLSREGLSRSLRQLYSTGLYDTLEAEGVRQVNGVGVGVDLIFSGAPRQFIGTVSVYGAKGATVNTQLEAAVQLSPGTRFTEAKLDRALRQMRAALGQDGYYQPRIGQKLTPHPGEQLVDLAFDVDSGPQARVGKVQLTGDAGMNVEKFSRVARLRAGARVDRDTVSRALAGALKHYQRQDRMEAEIKLESEQYVPGSRKVDFRFSVTRGPVVKVDVEGASVEPDVLKRLVPIFEEGTVDEDLLNEGNRNLRDYFERQGYFQVKVDHREETPRAGLVEIVYGIHLGRRSKVARVTVEGNRYFDAATLEGLLSVHAKGILDADGVYSQALVAADVNAIEGVYEENGFSSVKVTPEIEQGTGNREQGTAETAGKISSATATGAGAANSEKAAELRVVYRIDEGPQLRAGTVAIEGNDHMETSRLKVLLNTAAGQPLSPQSLAGDRNALLTAYMNEGFDQVRVTVAQKVEKADPDKVDVTFNIDEGPQTFVRNVLLTGLHYTRRATVERAIAIHPGQPLSQSALTETQRNLYDFGLFDGVNAAVQNPNGAQSEKTVLVQAEEAKRWSLTYGVGLEAQTGQPVKNCKGLAAAGISCSPYGRTGVSPRVLGDLTRSDLFGRDQSASLQGSYGLLEESLNLLYQIPHFAGRQNFKFTLSGGYANSQDVTTYVASRLEAGFRWTQNFSGPQSMLSRANTFVYEYDFRRVKVAASSLQVCPCDLTELSTASRVAGPSVTWIRDTRDSPLDAHHGTYTSFQDFLSVAPLGAEAEFNRIDTSNASYYNFDKGRFVLARNTRYGQVRAFGVPAGEFIPLPERLYAGGAVSLRGFSQNAAGPRDPETGYPVGGAGVLYNQTELRFPPPTLPWFGNALSLTLFEDMGNVFADAGEAWKSALRIHQPDRETTCSAPYQPGTNPVTGVTNPPPTVPPPGPITSTGPQGECSFNYFSHAPGIGLLYHTPVGPIRLDFSYNLNPPKFPITYNYSLQNPLSPSIGEASHFNFFFSLGQAF
ncbi:MAG: POTRA domain-containing protein [Terracidiphilus sp.]